MTTLRPFRNDDLPALSRLWNGTVPASVAARPLSSHEFDSHVLGKPHFDSKGLIVAEREGAIVGFVHAGFGPESANHPPWRLSTALGTIALLLVEPGPEATTTEDHLIQHAERYLTERGASVFYAGGQTPLNPYYWGIYGGSEWAGIPSAHTSFQQAVIRAGYEPVSTCVLLEADLTGPESRDVRGVLMRRQTNLVVDCDPLPDSWWDAIAIGEFRTMRYRLTSKSGDGELAHAKTWDMGWFARVDGRPRVGLIHMEVKLAVRRKGYGRHLLNEIFRALRDQGIAVVSIQTHETNLASLALYHSVGFKPVETSTLYRLPGGKLPRT